MYLLKKYQKINNRRCVSVECLGLYLTKRGCERDARKVRIVMNNTCDLRCEKMTLMIYNKCYARLFYWHRRFLSWRYSKAIQKANHLHQKIAMESNK